MKQVIRGELDRRPLGVGIRLIMTIAVLTLMAGSSAAAEDTITLRVDGMS